MNGAGGSGECPDACRDCCGRSERAALALVLAVMSDGRASWRDGALMKPVDDAGGAAMVSASLRLARDRVRRVWV